VEALTDPVNVFWTFIGILVWPELTLCIILWMLGHPLLGLMALLFGSTTNIKEVVKKQIVDSRTGKVISEHTE